METKTWVEVKDMDGDEHWVNLAVASNVVYKASPRPMYEGANTDPRLEVNFPAGTVDAYNTVSIWITDEASIARVRNALSRLSA